MLAEPRPCPGPPRSRPGCPAPAPGRPPAPLSRDSTQGQFLERQAGLGQWGWMGTELLVTGRERGGGSFLPPSSQVCRAHPRWFR